MPERMEGNQETPMLFSFTDTTPTLLRIPFQKKAQRGREENRKKKTVSIAVANPSAFHYSTKNLLWSVDGADRQYRVQ